MLIQKEEFITRMAEKGNTTKCSCRWYLNLMLSTIAKIGIYSRENRCVVEYKTPYELAEKYGLSMEQLADVIHRDNETAEFENWKCYLYYRRNGNVIIAIQRDKENKRKYY